MRPPVAHRIPLAVRARMNAATTSRFHSSISAASRQRSVRRRSMSSPRRSRSGRLLHRKSVGPRSDGIGGWAERWREGATAVPSRCGSNPRRAGVPAIAGEPRGGDPAARRRRLHRRRNRLREGLLARLRLGRPPRGARARGGHRAVAPRAALRLDGAPRADKKPKMAIGVLDRSAGIATAAGAAPVVIHPGYFLGRTREESIADVVEASWRSGRAARGQGTARPVRRRGDGPRGRARLGRGRVAIAAAVPGPARARLRAHARDQRRRLPRGGRVRRRARARGALLGPDEPFHIHFSDIQYANRNETKHLPYGDGTLRAEPLREALDRFDGRRRSSPRRPTRRRQAIRAILVS